MMNRIQEAMSLARNPRESEKAQALANIVATLENDQLDATEELYRSIGIETDVDRPGVDDRREELLGAVEAMTNGDLRAWFFSSEGPAARWLDQPEDAAAYADLEPEEWRDQIERWADTYRSQGVGDDLSDGDVAARHVERKFGVDIDTFEQQVVEWSPGAALEHVVARRFVAVEQNIRHMARILDQSDVSVDGGETDA
jgi:hypothetical protein